MRMPDNERDGGNRGESQDVGGEHQQGDAPQDHGSLFEGKLDAHAAGEPGTGGDAGEERRENKGKALRAAAGDEREYAVPDDFIAERDETYDGGEGDGHGPGQHSGFER